MTPHTIFLRKTCVLPDHFDLEREEFSDCWARVTRVGASALDGILRRAGWHFMWLQGDSSRTSIRSTREAAIHHALIRALKGLPSRFNAAELASVHVGKHLGFHIAKVIVEPRKIQHHTAFELFDKSDAP